MVRGKKILVFSGPGAENIGFWWSGDRKYWFLVVWGQKILCFSGPGTKYSFLVVRGQKILIFKGSGTENIGFGRSRESSWWGGRTGAGGRGRWRRESWTP